MGNSKLHAARKKIPLQDTPLPPLSLSCGYCISIMEETTCLEINKLMCYPQQLGRSWKILYRSPPELCLLCAPDSSATLSAICTGTVRNFMGHLHRDPPNLISRPEPSSISSAIYAGTVQNLISFLPGTRNPSEPYLQSAPEPSGTSSAFCPETPEPHQPSALEPSGNLSAICTGTLRNFISQLPRNCPEPHQPSAPEPSGNLISTEGSGTLRNLVRNLVLQLHRIAPELFWAKDPIANFAVGEQKNLMFYDFSTSILPCSSTNFKLKTDKSQVSHTVFLIISEPQAVEMNRCLVLRHVDGCLGRQEHCFALLDAQLPRRS